MHRGCLVWFTALFLGTAQRARDLQRNGSEDLQQRVPKVRTERWLSKTWGYSLSQSSGRRHSSLGYSTHGQKSFNIDTQLRNPWPRGAAVKDFREV